MLDAPLMNYTDEMRINKYGLHFFINKLCADVEFVVLLQFCFNVGLMVSGGCTGVKVRYSVFFLKIEDTCHS